MPNPTPLTVTAPASRVVAAPLRWVLLALAWFCVGLGFAGLALPVLPGTPFFILSAFLFSRSSPRFEHWIVTHPRLGPAVLAWRARGVVPRWAQLLATGSMVGSFTLLTVIGLPVVALVGIVAVMLAVAFYLLTRPVR